jgi:hypothetical protein
MILRIKAKNPEFDPGERELKFKLTIVDDRDDFSQFDNGIALVSPGIILSQQILNPSHSFA